MTNFMYIRFGEYEGQQVYYDVASNQVYLERDNEVLSLPTMDERIGLLEQGIIKLIDEYLMKGDLNG